MIPLASFLSFTLYALSSTLPAQETCGIGKDFHRGRRVELMKRMEGELLVFRGLGTPRSGERFRQDDTFWYLTGIESPGAALILDAATGREVLLLPPPDPAREIRSGQIMDAEDHWVTPGFGFEEIEANDPQTNVRLVALLEELLGERKTLGLALYPTITTGTSHHRAYAYERARAADRLDGRKSRADQLAARLSERLGVRILDVEPALAEMRWRKSAEEVRALTWAGSVTAQAITEAMRSTRSGVSGSQLAALLDLMQARSGGDGPSFPAVVRSGRQATMLASTADRELVAGELCLVEFGAERDHYASRVTRTWPVGGTFTERQGELYDAVLAAQRAAIAAVRPGARLVDVDAAATQVFLDRGLFALRRHFACYFVGLEPVDPPLRRTFEPGCVLAVGPGLYDREEGLGVRIEDVVLVTETGARVLTEGVPKEREALERAVAERGVLDWLEDRRN